MTSELCWMTLTVLMTALFWVPYVLDRLAVRGPWTALSDPRPESGEPHSLWAQRAIKAHANAAEKSCDLRAGRADSRRAQHLDACHEDGSGCLFLRPPHALPGLHRRRAGRAHAGVRRRLGAQIVILASILNLLVVRPQ